MPEAHSVLWCLGVFVGLWGLTLVVRGLPPDVVARARARFRRSGASAGTAAEGVEGARGASQWIGDWRLVVGGMMSILAGGVAIAAGFAVYEWVNGPRRDFYAPLWASAAVGVAAFSLSVLIWAIRGQVTRMPRCPVCLYDMAGGGNTCPECGYEGRAAADFLRPRRRKRVAMLAAAMLLLSPSLMLVPAFQKGGAMGLVPTTVLIAGFEWWPERWIFWTNRWDASLEERFYDGEMAEWQNRWLERRILRLTLSPDSKPEAATRALRLSMELVLTPEPEAGIARLIELVTDPSEAVRSQFDVWAYLPWTNDAAQQSAWIIERDAERLAALLQDPDPHVALTAATLLMVLPERTQEAMEAAVVHAGASVPGRYQASLVMRGAVETQGARAYLLELLRDPRPAANRMATAALQRSQLPAEALVVLDELLHDADVQVAARATEVLMYQSEGDWLIKVLGAAAGRPPEDAAVLMTAAKNDAYGLFQQTSSIASALGSDDAWMRSAGLELLESLVAVDRGIDDAREAIRRVAHEDDDAELRRRARALLRVLEGAGGSEGQEPLGGEPDGER